MISWSVFITLWNDFLNRQMQDPSVHLMYSQTVQQLDSGESAKHILQQMPHLKQTCGVLTKLWDKEYAWHWPCFIRRPRLLPSQRDSPCYASDTWDEWHRWAGRRWVSKTNESKAHQSETRRPCRPQGGGGLSNLLQVWIYHRDWRECKWSQSTEMSEVYMDSTELIVCVQELGVIFCSKATLCSFLT